MSNSEKLRKIIREEVRRVLKEDKKVEITSGDLKDGYDYVSREDFVQKYVNVEPASPNFEESVEILKKIDDQLHFLVGKLMDHDKMDHQLPDRVPEYNSWVSEETLKQYIENLKDSDVEGDPGEKFTELFERIVNLHASLHHVMAQHIRHHVDMSGDNSVVDKTKETENEA